jgi:hypothetical protein
VSQSVDIIGHSNDTCGDCLSFGYIGCLEPGSLDGTGPSPEPFLGKDTPVDLLTLESAKPVDEYSKFEGWGDWETLMNEPLHSAILSREIDYRRKIGCSRYEKGYTTISEYTLSGKSPFRRRCLSQTTNIQGFHFQLA